LCILFTDDVILMDEDRTEVDQKLELCRKILKEKCFRLNRSKIEYTKYDFSAITHEEVNVGLIVRWYSRNTSFTT
jgi:hypothetical protein